MCDHDCILVYNAKQFRVNYMRGNKRAGFFVWFVTLIVAIVVERVLHLYSHNRRSLTREFKVLNVRTVNVIGRRKKYDPTLEVFMFLFKYRFFLKIRLRHTHKLKRLLAYFQWLVWMKDIIVCPTSVVLTCIPFLKIWWGYRVKQLTRTDLSPLS